MTTTNERANTLEHLIFLNRALSNALDALEIARDTAKTPADRQQAENEIPAAVQAKTLLRSKIDSFISKSSGVGYRPADRRRGEEDAEAGRGFGQGGRASHDGAKDRRHGGEGN